MENITIDTIINLLMVIVLIIHGIIFKGQIKYAKKEHLLKLRNIILELYSSFETAPDYKKKILWKEIKYEAENYEKLNKNILLEDEFIKKILEEDHN